MRRVGVSLAALGVLGLVLVLGGIVALERGSADPGPWAPWPMFQHDAQRSGRSPYVGPQGPNAKWEFIPDNPEEAFDSPVIGADGTVYVGTIYSGLSPSGLYAITQEGQLAWLHESGVIPSSPALGPDGTVYVLTQGPNELVALNPNGTVKWRIEGVSWAIYDPVEPVVGDDATLYHVTDCILPGGESHPSLVAFDPDGFVRWFHDLTDRQTYPGANCSFPAGGTSWHSNAPFSSPALGEDGTIYLVNDDRVFALDADGAQKWNLDLERPCDPGNCFVSISPDGTIYAAVSGRDWPSPPAHIDWADLYALSPEGFVIWNLLQEASDLSWVRAPAVGADGTLYLVRWTYGFAWPVLSLMAVGPDGSLMWSDVLSYGSVGAPVVGGGGSIYTWGQGTLRAYAPDGTLSWTAYASGPPGGVGLAIGPDGTLYVAGNKLYAFGPGPEAGFCLPYENENELREETRVDCRSTFVLDPGVGDYISRDLLLAYAPLFEAKGWSKNFLWYASETTLEVPGDDPRNWSYCVRDSPRDGAACRVENVRPAFSISELFGGNPVTLHMYAYDDPNDTEGAAFINRVCGNYSEIRTVPVPSISGHKWEDLNGDGVWQQPAEPPVADCQIHLRAPDGSERDTWTDANGYYRFDLLNLPPGTYTVEELCTDTPSPATSVYVPEGAGDTEFAGNDFGNPPTPTPTFTPTATYTPTPTPTATATPTVTPTPVRVGGIVELPAMDEPPPGQSASAIGDSAPSGETYAAVAGGMAAGVMALAAGAWYARRRWAR